MVHLSRLLKTGKFLLVISGVVVLFSLVLSTATPVYAGSTPKAQLWGCVNGSAADNIPPSDACTGVQGGQSNHGWSSNGNIQLNISNYTEAQTVPWRVEMTNLPPGETVTLIIKYSFVNGAITWDYANHWDASVSSSNAGPCDGTALAGCGMTSNSQYNIPVPPVLNQAAGGNATNYTCPIAPPGNQSMTLPLVPGRHMDAYGGVTITNIQYITPVPSCVLPNPNSDDSFRVTFTTPTSCSWNGNAMLLWGQHIARQQDWGSGNTATVLGNGGSASPYHVSLESWSFTQNTNCNGQSYATNGLNTQQIQMKVAGPQQPTAVTLSKFGGREVTPGDVNLEWTTAMEVNTAGFNIYRGLNPNGPYARINLLPIPASFDPLAGGTHQYADTNVIPGRTYYYQLEDIEYDGTYTRHSPVSVTVPAVMALDYGILVLVGLVIGLFLSTGIGFRFLRKKVSRVVG